MAVRPGLGDGAPVLGDGGARARGRGAGARGARLRFGAVEWRLRIGARARGKKGKQGSTVGSSPHPAVLSVYTAGSTPNPAVLSLCRPLQSASHVYFIQDKVEANMAVIHSRQICLLRMYIIVLIRHIFNKFYTIRSGGI